MILTHGANSLRSGGGIPLPPGYHSVAAVYIPDGANTQSKQLWTITETDISGWSFSGRVYNPNVLNQGTNHMYLFQFGSVKTYCAVRIYSKTMAHISLPMARAADGSSYIDINSESGQAPLYPTIFDYSMQNGTAHIGPYTITEIAQAEPNLVTNIAPFVWGGGGSSTLTADLATIYLKAYDADGVLRYDFVPAVREADDYAGLYDLVNNVFYTNQYITSLTEIPE